MKKPITLAIITSLFFSASAHTQQHNSAEMMKMMADAQNCMMQLDYAELAAMEAKSKALESEILGLCASGNEAEAKAVALKFSDEVMNSKTMLGMKKCFAAIPGMQEQLQIPDFREELEQRSICDIVKNQQQ